MRAFAIRFHNRRFLARNRPAREPHTGWYPIRWANVVDAEKFGSREAAEAFLSNRPYRDNPDVTVVELGGGSIGGAA